MEIRKEACLTEAGRPTEEELELINGYTRSPLGPEEVYCFSVRLCDDAPDRDFERFDTGCLPALAELFLGKTGISDHNWSARGQVARIFRTQVERDGDTSYILARCYMLREPENDRLIAQIEGGIHREVSVGCAMGASRCSVCGSPYGACEHRKGRTYGGQTCLEILTDPVDAYEFSFVAVPAQRQAGVMKGLKGGEEEKMTLKELVAASGTGEQQRDLERLEQEAAFGRRSRKALEEEVVSLGLLLHTEAREDILRKGAGALSCEELTALRDALTRKARRAYPLQTQLPGGKTPGEAPAMDADFLI